ncbi:uncharacterized protein BO97DRAFT_4356 [Aspergillus homomorphus CBS 101889]|uniref:Uncharacterized protein n=1 Tax=Aspergillus homomorphus (strain CBS 101889) TaxID=1450537 RepID=A0A395IGI9_ASPHC|nr:hypothetical protein BO97DRAFT_4356 [Aspergillus homomorphus CBS 101889]RAL17304.1 hypothetical protein BO97DRAFT_4356 [Aspergillus homomorphus CBS 101889]
MNIGLDWCQTSIGSVLLRKVESKARDPPGPSELLDDEACAAPVLPYRFAHRSVHGLVERARRQRRRPHTAGVGLCLVLDDAADSDEDYAYFLLSFVDSKAVASGSQNLGACRTEMVLVRQIAMRSIQHTKDQTSTSVFIPEATSSKSYSETLKTQFFQLLAASFSDDQGYSDQN